MLALAPHACTISPHPWVSARQEAGSSGAEAAAALEARLAEAVQIRGLLARNTEEVDGLLRALGGEYVLPEAGGDLLRDGAGVLPTGAAALGQQQTHGTLSLYLHVRRRRCAAHRYACSRVRASLLGMRFSGKLQLQIWVA